MREKIKTMIVGLVETGTVDTDELIDQILSLFKAEIEKLKLLSDEAIEAVIRKRFPLFELNEEDEEDRKATTLDLLQAQLAKTKEDLLGRMK